MVEDNKTPLSGKDIHGKVEQLRESGDFWDSIKLAQDGIAAYLNEKNYLGLADIHGSVSLSYRHLYKQTQDKNYLVLAEGAATSGIEVAKINGLESAIVMPLYNLAKVQEDLGQLGEATQTYMDVVEAFQKNPPPDHNRQGVLADMKIHAYTCQFKAGDDTALPKILASIEELEKSDEATVSKYNYDVWLSGANMGLAEALLKRDKELAKKHLDEAKKIIDANNDLKLRKGQWEKLNQNFL